MKRTTLFLLTAMMTANSLIAQTATSMDTTSVLNPTVYLDSIAQGYGTADKTVISLEDDPLSGRVRSRFTIVPFEAEQPERLNALSSLIAKANQAFGSHMYGCYSFGSIKEGSPHESYVTYFGDTKAHKLTILEKEETMNLTFMERKDSDDPTLRWFYGIKWKKATGGSICGTVYIILSKRPDLVTDANELTQAAQRTTVHPATMIGEDIKVSLDDATKEKIIMLERLLSRYEEELKRLRNERELASHSNNITLVNSITSLMEDLMKKRRETLGMLHKIVISASAKN